MNAAAQSAASGASPATVRRHLALGSAVSCPGCGLAVPLQASAAAGWIEAHACAAGRLDVHVELEAQRPWAWQFVQA